MEQNLLEMKTNGKCIAITGGIGSGKSVVSEILSVMGYHVYDCDSRAKLLMDTSKEIQNKLCLRFGDDIVVNGNINRANLADIVFHDVDKLRQLNELVHTAVRHDIEKWRAEINANICFIESAILRESGLDKSIDAVIVVDAPIDMRIARVMKRNSISQDKVEARIKNQASNFVFNSLPTFIINNDDNTSVLSQINAYVKAF